MTIEEFIALDKIYAAVLAPDFRKIAKMTVDPEYKVKKFNKKRRQNYIHDCDSTKMEAIFARIKRKMT